MLYKAFRDYDRARAELDLARASLPNNPIAYIYTAAIDRRQGRWAESIRNWERGLELDPRNFRYAHRNGLHLSGACAALPNPPPCSSAPSRSYRAINLPGPSWLKSPSSNAAISNRCAPALADILNEDPKAATEIANGLFYSCARGAGSRWCDPRSPIHSGRGSARSL